MVAGAAGAALAAPLGPVGMAAVGGAAWALTAQTHKRGSFAGLYEGRCDEVELYDRAKWEELIGEVWENPREGLEQEKVPPPKLIDADCAHRHDDGHAYERLWVQPSPHSRNPSEDIQALQWKIARRRGGIVPEHVGTTYITNQPPVIELLISYTRHQDLPALEHAIVSEPGHFHLGMFLSGEPIIAAPFETVNPLWLIAGESGSGKSSLMSLVCASALQWKDWSLTVIDGNFGADYVWVKDHGGELVLGPNAGISRMRDLLEEVDERNRELGAKKWEFTRADGGVFRREARKLSEAPQEAIDEYIDKQGWGFGLLVIDEAQRVLGEKKGERAEAQRLLQGLVAGARKAGLALCLGIHRPGAEQIGGYSRDQFSIRTLLGKPRKATARMVNEDEGAWQSAFDIEEEYPPGIGTFDGCGIPPVRRPRRGQLFYLDPDFLGEVVRRPRRTLPLKGGTESGGGEGERERGKVAGNKEETWWKRVGVTGAVKVWLEQGVMAMRLVARTRTYGYERRPEFRQEVISAAATVACRSCGHDGFLHADHVTPLWAGGADAAENGQLLCVGCHRVKTWWEGLVRRHRYAIVATAAIALMVVYAVTG